MSGAEPGRQMVAYTLISLVDSRGIYESAFVNADGCDSLLSNHDL